MLNRIWKFGEGRRANWLRGKTGESAPTNMRLRQINFIAWALFAGFLVLPFFLYVGSQLRLGLDSFPRYHTGFVYIYGVGRIALEYPAVRIYDLGLQEKTFNALSPAPEGFYGPSPYPPMVACVFSLFARLPFGSAYLLWAVISLLLYLAGLRAAALAAELRGVQERWLFYCLSLAFYPFFVETFFYGQLSAIAVCCIGFAVLADRRASPHTCGLALSILVYKPTLLLLLIPMLIVTRRLKALAGFAAGAAVLCALTTATAGTGIWIEYLRFTKMFSQVAGVHGSSGMNLSKYVDFSAVSHTIPGGRSAVGLAILACASGAAALSLAVLLWRSAKLDRPAQQLAWAATLTWTLLLNVYVPVWDCSLAAISMVLTCSALRELEWKRAMRWSIALFLLTLVASWLTEGMVKPLHIQILTILLSVLGVGQLVLLSRATGRASHLASATALPEQQPATSL
jgi:hypothetical protein